MTVNISKFIESLQITKMKSKEKAELVSAVFGIKFS